MDGSDAQEGGTLGHMPGRRAPRTSYLIKRAQYAVYVQLEERLKAFDLTAAQYAVFSIVGHRDGLSSAQLARRFAVTPQTMIKLIALLENKGLIRRSVDSDNRRALKVAVTAAGKRMLAKCEAEIDRMESDVFASFTGRELRQFREMLSRLLTEPRTPERGTGHGDSA
jgi:DNA-binding MarR family transcriptional regulator